MPEPKKFEGGRIADPIPAQVGSLMARVAKLERDVAEVRGDGGRAIMHGDLDMNGNQIIGLRRSGTSDMAVARDELTDLVVDNVIFREDIATTGTAHQLANTPGDSTKVVLVYNGSVMEQNGTGYEGYTITTGGAITTVTSIATADELFAMYVRFTG